MPSREVNGKGNIHRWVKRLHRLEGNAEETLEMFARRVKPRGDVMIAATYLSRYGDRYYGQWILMNVPFRTIDELKIPEVDAVPDHLYYQALALHHRPAHWRNAGAIRADLELEAFRQHHIDNIVAMLQSHHILIDQYIAGTIHKDDYAVDLYAVRSSVPSQSFFVASLPRRTRFSF